jgi:hypothetical protein
MAKGASIYLSASELEALYNAHSYLSALLEAADDAGDLVETKAGLISIAEKARRAMQSSAQRATHKR